MASLNVFMEAPYQGKYLDPSELRAKSRTLRDGGSDRNFLYGFIFQHDIVSDQTARHCLQVE